MEKTVKKFDGGIQITYYEFSKDIVCVDVYHYGKSMGAFCSDVSYFQEWDESDLLQLAKTHMKQAQSIRNPKHHDRRPVAQYEIEYSTHFEDMVCINVYKDDLQVAAFCSDRYSFEEWIEDEELLAQVVTSQAN